MKTYMWIVCLAIFAIASVGCSNSSAAQPKPLTCGDGTFTEFQLTNTNERSYTSMGQTCRLTAQADGVIWIATGTGYAMSDAAEKLTFSNDQGVVLGSTCWVQSGTINGETQTQLILFGPANSQRINVCCGDACTGTVITE